MSASMGRGACERKVQQSDHNRYAEPEAHIDPRRVGLPAGDLPEADRSDTFPHKLCTTFTC